MEPWTKVLMATLVLATPATLPENQPLPEVTDYRVDRDRAMARAGDHVLDFVRIEGRWYSVPPSLPEISEPKGLPCPSACH